MLNKLFIRKSVLLLVVITFCLELFGQQSVVLQLPEQRSQYEGKSYQILQTLSLQPGFYVSGASNGSWYAKCITLTTTPPLATNPEMNFVRTERILKSGFTTESQVRALTIADKNTLFEYIDGMGRTVQTNAVNKSPYQENIIQPYYYDALGRPSRRYIPFVSGAYQGTYDAQAMTDQGSYFSTPPSSKITADSRAYDEITFDSSPLNRVTQTTAIGAAWSNKPTTYGLTLNDANTVRLWTISNGLPTSSSCYPAGSLVIKQTTNEENTISRSYTDFLGRIVMIESQTVGGAWARTYCVYDLYNKPLFIIPPAASSNLSPDNTFANRWYYQYQYDYLQRKSAMKSPGAPGWEYIIYDQWDRPVLKQDANQRAKATPEWRFVKYDDLNRPIATGIYQTTATRAALTTAVATSTGRYETRNTSSIGYTMNQTFPSTVGDSDLLTILYYDDYSFLSNSQWDAESNSYSFVPETGYTGVPFSNTKDLVTGGKMKILNTTTWLNNVNYYDNRYRLLQTISENQYGKTERITKEYDFVDNILKAKQTHTDATQTFTSNRRYTYDMAGRPADLFLQVNNQPEVLLSSSRYNEIGQPIKSKIHSTDNGSTFLQAIDYRYNIRGWNTNINNTSSDPADPSDYFGMDVAYENSQSGNSARYDGMISGARWKHDLSAKSRVYNYTYDKNLLTAAAYKVDGSSNAQVGVYDEKQISYDLNGNIQALTRNSGTLTASATDQLTYTYEAGASNELMSVTDGSQSTVGFKDGNTSGDDYVYDANGNVTVDRNKGIMTSSGEAGIIYNLLNLPDRVNLSNGDYILYSYDAGGVKLTQSYYNSSNVRQSKIDYSGGFVYINDQRQFLLHERGRIVTPSYANLIGGTAVREANSLDGYISTTHATVTSVTANTQTYVQVACTLSGGNEGLSSIGGPIAVKPGENYTFKVLGYQSTGTNAYLYVTSPSGDLVWTGAPLPVGAGNENFVSSSFAVPSGVTQITLGVKWNGAVSGNTFLINRVSLYKTDWEFQYFLKDNQGSPRVVLQTAPHTYTFTATMERQNFTLPQSDGTDLGESAQFLNLKLANELTSAGNATTGGSYAYVLNSSNHVGPGRSFKVLPGDVVNASVSSYFITGGTYSKTPLSNMASYVAQALTGGVAGAIDGVSATSYTNSGASVANFTLSPNQGSAAPSAFLNYILFDETYTPIEAKSQPVGTASGVKQTIQLPTISVTQTGYLYVYLSYDNEAGGPDVYFDELRISYTESPVIQINSYYPHGLTAFNWSRDGEVQNNFQYQGKEFIPSTGWHDFGSRLYWSDIGRWFSNDPQGGLMPYASNYSAMMGNPVMNVDPEGECPICIVAVMVIAGTANVIANADHLKGGVFSWDGLEHFLAGAAGGAVATVNPQLGFLIAGTLNTVADQVNHDGRTILQSFITGGFSALAGAEAYEAIYDAGEEGVADAAADNAGAHTPDAAKYEEAWIDAGQASRTARVEKKLVNLEKIDNWLTKIDNNKYGKFFLDGVKEGIKGYGKGDEHWDGWDFFNDFLLHDVAKMDRMTYTSDFYGSKFNLWKAAKTFGANEFKSFSKNYLQEVMKRAEGKEPEENFWKMFVDSIDDPSRYLMMDWEAGKNYNAKFNAAMGN